jgi:hypothetical protein
MIKVADVELPSIECERCPGHLHMYPETALAAHNNRYHNGAIDRANIDEERKPGRPPDSTFGWNGGRRS